MTTADVALCYTAMCIDLDDLAIEVTLAGRAPLATRIRHSAAIAYRAAKAEHDDPVPDLFSRCLICLGVAACDWDAHRIAMVLP